jgi:SulP family sulfate permease
VTALANGNDAASLHPTSETPTGLATVVPPLIWLPRYKASWLTGDVIAGITLAAYAIPVSLAYATLAGLPPHFGI